MLDEARRALDAIEAAVRRTRRAAEPELRLVLALKADLDGGLPEPILAAYGRSIGVVLCNWSGQAQLVRDGRADVALVRAPVSDRALDHEVLAEESQLVALAAAHPPGSCFSSQTRRRDACQGR